MTDTGGMPRIQWVNFWLQNIAIVVAGVWVLYAFVWQEFLKPYRDPLFINSRLRIAVEHKPRELSSGQKIWVLTVEAIMENAGKRIAYIPGGYITLRGVQFDPRNPPELPTEAQIADSFYPIILQMKYFNESTLENEEVARVLVFPEWILEPGETASRSFPVYIPVKEFDVVYALMKVTVAKHRLVDIFNDAVTHYRIQWVPERKDECQRESDLLDDEFCAHLLSVLINDNGEEEPSLLEPFDDYIWQYDASTMLPLPPKEASSDKTPEPATGGSSKIPQ